MRTSRLLIASTCFSLVSSVGSAYGESDFGYKPPGSPTPSATVTTANPAGEQNWFTLDWSVEQRRSGARWITGYIYNRYGRAAVNMRLLAQAFDASGNLVGQELGWVPGTVPGGSRTYFALTRLPEAHHYRVSVWTFDFTQGVGGGAPSVR